MLIRSAIRIRRHRDLQISFVSGAWRFPIQADSLANGRSLVAPDFAEELRSNMTSCPIPRRSNDHILSRELRSTETQSRKGKCGKQQPTFNRADTWLQRGRGDEDERHWEKDCLGEIAYAEDRSKNDEP